MFTTRNTNVIKLFLYVTDIPHNEAHVQTCEKSIFFIVVLLQNVEGVLSSELCCLGSLVHFCIFCRLLLVRSLFLPV